MTSPDPTAGTVLGDRAWFALLDVVCSDRCQRQSAHNAEIDRIFAALDPHIKAALAAARDAGREEGRRPLINAAARYLDYTRHGEDLDFMNEAERLAVERALHGDA